MQVVLFYPQDDTDAEHAAIRVKTVANLYGVQVFVLASLEWYSTGDKRPKTAVLRMAQGLHRLSKIGTIVAR